MKTFDLRKFLAENKLTIDAKNINEMNLYNLSDLPSDVEWKEGGVADTGTDNPLGLELGERESYDVEVFGYSPSTGKSYTGLAAGSYGETDFDTIDNIEEVPSNINEYEKESFNWTQEIEEDFVAWIIDGNAIKNPDGTYSTQDSMYKNRLASIDELKRYYYKEYLR
jgi:hypothetical protein